MNDIDHITCGKWHGILSKLGIPDNFLKNSHGPCPLCDGNDRYRFDDKEGRGTYYCSGCGAGNGYSLLMKFHGWDFKQTIDEIKGVVGVIEQVEQKQKKDPRILLRKIAAGAEKLTGDDPVSKYLEGRGLLLHPSEIRYHPKLAYYDAGVKTGEYPAMLSVVKNKEGKCITYHVTYLTKYGGKADVPQPKKIMSPIEKISGSSIHLFGDGEHVCVTEGVETGIAAHEDTGLPVRAAINSTGMESLIVGDNVNKVTIYGDNDMSYTGQKAAYVLANRLVVREKKEVDVIISRVIGNDFLDDWASA